MKIQDYTSHNNNCAKLSKSPSPPLDSPCTCGLDNAIRDVENMFYYRKYVNSELAHGKTPLCSGIWLLKKRK